MRIKVGAEERPREAVNVAERRESCICRYKTLCEFEAIRLQRTLYLPPSSSVLTLRSHVGRRLRRFNSARGGGGGIVSGGTHGMVLGSTSGSTLVPKLDNFKARRYLKKLKESCFWICVHLVKS
ncbi:unnamed protein product [Dovyalis caffra]|uniref:Uncharacterized protein n=1 Tax=Dovyalis caffra TaxID=77055 RepID=A0AAV1RAE1_9ROSI|nr:unnamed protein product [Dovyalis caffra]